MTPSAPTTTALFCMLCLISPLPSRFNPGRRSDRDVLISNDRRFELLPILGYSFIMLRRCDRNGLGSVAAVLSALSAFLVMHQTQAKNASRVSWISPTAFSPKPLKLASL